MARDNPYMQLPDYNPSMPVIYTRTQRAIQAHWKAHNNAYPQMIRLTPAQADDLVACQLYGQFSMPGADRPKRDRFFGCHIQIDDSTPGEIVAADGTVTPLAEFDPPAKK